MTVTTTSSTSGNTTITNLRTGQVVVQHYYNTWYPLCASTAEWIAEDFGSSDGSGSLPFADFGSVSIRDTQAQGSSGTITAASSDIVNMVINGAYKISCGANQNGVKCDYVN